MDKETLESYLKQPEYKIIPIILTAEERKDSDYLAMELSNRVLGRSFHHTFEKWLGDCGRIPTPKEFIESQLEDVRKDFNNEEWKINNRITFDLTPTVLKGLNHRLLRSYISFINELHTTCLIQELFPHVKIERNDLLDFEGIDILVIDDEFKTTHNIHITKNSASAIDNLFKKEGKFLEFRGYQTKLWAVPKWKKLSHNIYSERNFEGHTFLLYSSFENDETLILNGYPLFKDKYIMTKLGIRNNLHKGA